MEILQDYSECKLEYKVGCKKDKGTASLPPFVLCTTQIPRRVGVCSLLGNTENEVTGHSKAPTLQSHAIGSEQHGLISQKMLHLYLAAGIRTLVPAPATGRVACRQWSAVGATEPKEHSRGKMEL